MNMKVLSVLIVVLVSFSIPTAYSLDVFPGSYQSEAVDNDEDGYVASEDCDDNDPTLNESCPLQAYRRCTNANRFVNQCLPVVTDVETMLENLENLALEPDRFEWSDILDGSGQKISPSRPTDDPFAYFGWSDFWNLFGSIIRSPWKVLDRAEDIFFDFFGFDGGWNFWPPTNYLHSFQMAKKHLQSIQYIDKGPYTGNVPSKRFLVTSISDETEHNLIPDDQAAIQLVLANNFGDEGGTKDKLIAQRLLNDDIEVARYNHPGGSQIIGEYVFLALENFGDPDTYGPVPGLPASDLRHWPATGVWRVDRANEEIEFRYAVVTRNEGDFDVDDRHQSTAAVTRLSDDTFLLAVCVYKECDYINFYKSTKISLHEAPNFTFIGLWKLPEHDADDDTWWEEAWSQEPPGDHWSDCGPQNMNFAVNANGEMYLVMFGGEASIGSLDCATLLRFSDNLYGYRVDIESSRQDGNLEYQIRFAHIKNVRGIPGRYRNTKSNWKELRSFVWMPNFHGLNLMAGSGLWLSPDGKDTIAYLATEHYDSARSYKRPVNADSRWGVSSNWDHLPLIWVDNYLVEVDEGSTALNTGFYEIGDNITLSASIGTILKGSADTWSWSWLAKDGPDDSQMVTLSRTDDGDASDSAHFDLLVRNVPPTADAGLDQIVECVYGEPVSLNASGSTDPGEDTLIFMWEFLDVPGSSAPAFNTPDSANSSFLPNALGTYLAEVTVTDDDDAFDTDDVMILFEDTTPPVISSLGATPDVLWPPNNKLVPVVIDVLATDACDTAPVCAIASIESNEPSGNEDDSIITGAFTTDLRAQRLGSGSGRVYTISVQCSDYAGNSTSRTTTVTVPHDQKRRIK